MVTTICFLEDVEQALKEAYRVLELKGHIIVGFIDAESQIGKYYEEHKAGSRFYAQARFLSVKQVISLLKKVHFKDLHFRQTIFNLPNQLAHLDPVRKGMVKVLSSLSEVLNNKIIGD